MPTSIIRGLLFVLFIWLVPTGSYAISDIGQRSAQIKEIELVIKGDGAPRLTDVSISEKSSLADYIQIGLRNNLGIKAAFYKWKSAFQKITQAFSLPDPQFTFTDYIDEVETRAGPQQRAFSIRQRFPLPDKLWIRKRQAFRAEEIAYYNFERKRFDLIYQISSLYYEYAYLYKAIFLTRENMELLQNFEKVAQVRYASGLQKNQDLLKVQVELGRLENDLYSLMDLRSSIVAGLNALLNLAPDTILPWPTEALEDVHIEDRYLSTDILMDVLRRANPHLLALSEDIERRRQSLRLAQREFFPDLTVGLTKIDTDNALNPATQDSGKDALMLMFSVNLPIWFGRIKANVEDARASLISAQNQRKDKENELLSRLALVHYKLRDGIRQFYLYKKDLIPKAMQTLAATQAGYEAGKVDFLSLIDAQRVLLNFQLSYYRHSADLYQRLAELKSLLGEE